MKGVQIGKEWDGIAAHWSASLRGGLDLINERFGVQAFMERIGSVEGLRVLDAGCGEGRSARHLARAGASVSGVDVSEAMIREAIQEEGARPLGIDYFVASCAALDQIPSAQFDVVTSFMALMDTPDLPRVLSELHRVLKPGGHLAVMVRHPCFFTFGFRVRRADVSAESRLMVGDYFRRKPYRERLALAGQTERHYEIVRFPYTLADYLSGLLGNGFEISRVDEPRPSEAMATEVPNLAFWRQHAALYLFIQARKRGAAD